MPAPAVPPLPADPAAALAVLASLTDPQVLTDVLAARPPLAVPDWEVLGTLVRVGMLALELSDGGPTAASDSYVARHVRDCADRGADLSVPGVWSSTSVEHTLTAISTGPQPTRVGVMAGPLRRASRLLVPDGQPHQPYRGRRKQTQAPYNTAELAAYVETVTNLGAPMWRARASLVLALGAGAGLLDADLRQLTVSSVAVTDTAVLVTVPGGPRARTVALHHGLELLAVAALRMVVDADPRLARPDAQLVPAGTARVRCGTASPGRSR